MVPGRQFDDPGPWPTVTNAQCARQGVAVGTGVAMLEI